MNIIQHPSPNFDPRPKPIDMIVIHYTDMLTAKDALDRLSNPEAIVSSHYLISEKGETYQLVDDKNRARHAGVSSWQDVQGLNDTSIGIELANPGHTNGYVPFPAAQMQSLIDLCHLLMTKHKIQYVLGHSDIAPTRKMDPGEFFDWKLLADQGIGIWPKEGDFSNREMPSAEEASQILKKIGYGFNVNSPEEVKLAFLAFQRHFVQDNLTGILDTKTWEMLNALDNIKG